MIDLVHITNNFPYKPKPQSTPTSLPPPLALRPFLPSCLKSPCTALPSIRQATSHLCPFLFFFICPLLIWFQLISASPPSQSTLVSFDLAILGGIPLSSSISFHLIDFLFKYESWISIIFFFFFPFSPFSSLICSFCILILFFYICLLFILELIFIFTCLLILKIHPATLSLCLYNQNPTVQNEYCIIRLFIYVLKLQAPRFALPMFRSSFLVSFFSLIHSFFCFQFSISSAFSALIRASSLQFLIL